MALCSAAGGFQRSSRETERQFPEESAIMYDWESKRGCELRVLAATLVTWTLVSGVQANTLDADTPEAASERHLSALMTLENEAISATMMFPFVHIDPDGSKTLIADAGDLPDMRSLPFRTRLTNAVTLRQKLGTAIVYVEFQRYDLAGNPTRSGSAVWGLVKQDSSWKVSWRQFFGLDNESPSQ